MSETALNRAVDLIGQGFKLFDAHTDELEAPQIERSVLMINAAQASATLALAYEQRTANLIALESLLQRAGSDVDLESIQERLGLA